jgi:hypothetical protein
MQTPRTLPPPNPAPVRFTLGLDLGKMSDFTALAIAEERPERLIESAVRFPGETVAPPTAVWGDDPAYALPWLQRWPLRTPYQIIAEEVAERLAALVALPSAEVALFVDGTGVGTAVVELLVQQPAIKAGRLEIVTITAGREVTRVTDGWHVAKGELVSVAQVALQRGKLNVAPTLPEARTLRDELGTFEVTLTEAANATFSHRDGKHDDLVLATALALWGAKQRPAYAVSYQFNYRTGQVYGRN